MQPAQPPRFSREQGSTEADWLRALPEAVRDCPWQLTGPQAARVQLPSGVLRLSWQVLPPRRIALIAMPRTAVDYAFDAAIPDAERHAFLRYFDLVLQRGGG